MDKIAVLDFGGQYAHLIANRVRRSGFFAEILLPQNLVDPAEELKGYKGIILSGGPQSVFAKESPQVDASIFELGKPILGICYGLQLIVHDLGGKVKKAGGGEYGESKLKVVGKSKLFTSVPKSSVAWMSHGDEVKKLPEGFEKTASTDNCEFAAVEDTKRSIFGVQFHPEVRHTAAGEKILANFLKICGAKKSWDLDKFLKSEITKIKKQVGKKKVFLLVSGGVDSTVAFALLEKALSKKRVFGLMIDTGLLRENEAIEVQRNLKKAGFENLKIVNEAGHFLAALRNITDPEEKRRVIGRVFLKVQRKVLKRLRFNPREWLLGQGTIYPDTIESAGTKNSDKIKTHHNRVEEIERMIEKGLIVEPLAELYKDEVREVGRKLKLPKNLIERHPFPGPGLGVRILCGESEKPKATNKIETEIYRKWKIRGKVLPLRSVGVQGDSRTFAHPVALFTASRDLEKLGSIATWIVNKFSDINRVVLSLGSSKAPRVFSAAPAKLTPSRVELAREADAIVNDILTKQKLYSKVWQFPVVLAPVFEKGGEAIILRPINSEEAMTANFARLPKTYLSAVTKKLQKLDGIEHVFIDLTNKPPATIEWE
ncbi:MAG: glutamine-hydrolyzing GMP synthase [Candidatus Peribacteraceae bacterium]|nr:glutamine-hydrolyzing GMP synthase [Candidatus Peribacteraceae bacterium]